MLERSVQGIIKTALKISPITLISGPRQSGKSTLSLSLMPNYSVLDDVSARVAASENPIGFIHNLPKPICIDEIQKSPNLLEAIKMAVDKDRKNGEFLLTGSANLLDMKQTKDTLAGRIIEVMLYPFSLKEKHQKAGENIIEMLFENEFDAKKLEPIDIPQQILDGGYPEITKLESVMEKRLWFSSYAGTYIERDARDMGEIREIGNFFKFVHILASRSGTILNKSSISADTGLKDSTVDNFTTIMEQIFQIKLIRPYFENIQKQFIKSPKIHFLDSGVLCHLLKITNQKSLEESNYKGQIYESFIASELLKHLAFCSVDTEIYHYRTIDKKEIDFLLKRGEKIVAIKVKASSSVNKGDFKHIVDFQERSRYEVWGVLFYSGGQILEFGDRCVALPMGFLG